jgi:phosphonate transport system ATP-binding protein
VIRIRGLRKVYPGGTVGIDGIDLDIGAGEVVTLIGPSGAGKSTFLRCLNGLVTPTDGDVSVGGQAVSGASAVEMRRIRAGIGFVFQQFNLLRRLSVLENVLIGRLAQMPMVRSLLGLFPAADVARAQAVLERVGLEGLGDRRVDTLSGGQQQRVAIARAVVQEPKVLLADEPMASLDPALAHTVLALLRRISEEDGLTVVTSLHVLELARLYGRRVIGLRAGRLVYDGPPDGLTNAMAERIFASRAA